MCFGHFRAAKAAIENERPPRPVQNKSPKPSPSPRLNQTSSQWCLLLLNLRLRQRYRQKANLPNSIPIPAQSCPDATPRPQATTAPHPIHCSLTISRKAMLTTPNLASLLLCATMLNLVRDTLVPVFAHGTSRDILVDSIVAVPPGQIEATEVPHTAALLAEDTLVILRVPTAAAMTAAATTTAAPIDNNSSQTWVHSVASLWRLSYKIYLAFNLVRKFMSSVCRIPKYKM